MRAGVLYARSSPAPADWCERLARLIEAQIHPAMLADCGVTAELLAYCGFTLNKLVLPRASSHRTMSHYYLEHLIEGLTLAYDDLLLLGLTLKHFAQPVHFPLIVLQQLCAFGAEQLFAFHMSFADLDHCVLKVDARYAVLLRLNLDYWRAVL